MNEVVSIDSAIIVTILCSAGDSAATADLLPIITNQLILVDQKVAVYEQFFVVHVCLDAAGARRMT